MDQDAEIKERIELVSKIKGRDKDAETRLYKKYKDRLRYFTRRKIVQITGTPDAELAEDVCQDAWVAVLENLRGGYLEKPEKLPSYIYQILSNKAIDSIKIRQREKSLDDLEKSGIHPLAPHDSQIPPKHKERFARVWRELRPKEKRILYLKYIHAWGHNQIAQILGISEENSRKLLQRAKARVRKKFQKPV